MSRAIASSEIFALLASAASSSFQNRNLQRTRTTRPLTRALLPTRACKSSARTLYYPQISNRTARLPVFPTSSLQAHSRRHPMPDSSHSTRRSTRAGGAAPIAAPTTPAKAKPGRQNQKRYEPATVLPHRPLSLMRRPSCPIGRMQTARHPTPPRQKSQRRKVRRTNQVSPIRARRSLLTHLCPQTTSLKPSTPRRRSHHPPWSTHPRQPVARCRMCPKTPTEIQLRPLGPNLS